MQIIPKKKAIEKDNNADMKWTWIKVLLKKIKGTDMLIMDN